MAEWWEQETDPAVRDLFRQAATGGLSPDAMYQVAAQLNQFPGEATGTRPEETIRAPWGKTYQIPASEIAASAAPWLAGGSFAQKSGNVTSPGTEGYVGPGIGQSQDPSIALVPGDPFAGASMDPLSGAINLPNKNNPQEGAWLAAQDKASNELQALGNEYPTIIPPDKFNFWTDWFPEMLSVFAGPAGITGAAGQIVGGGIGDLAGGKQGQQTGQMVGGLVGGALGGGVDWGSVGPAGGAVVGGAAGAGNAADVIGTSDLGGLSAASPMGGFVASSGMTPISSIAAGAAPSIADVNARGASATPAGGGGSSAGLGTELSGGSPPVTSGAAAGATSPGPAALGTGAEPLAGTSLAQPSVSSMAANAAPLPGGGNVPPIAGGGSSVLPGSTGAASLTPSMGALDSSALPGVAQPVSSIAANAAPSAGASTNDVGRTVMSLGSKLNTAAGLANLGNSIASGSPAPLGPWQVLPGPAPAAPSPPALDTTTFAPFVESWAAQQADSIRSQFASMGLSGSSMETSYLERAARGAEDRASMIADTMSQAGVSDPQIFSRLMNSNLQTQTQFDQALTSGALAA